MLVNFSVENYKSFKSRVNLEMTPGKSRNKTDHISQDCLKIAAIYGSNASGKSNLIHALKTMKQIVTNPFYYGNEPLYNWNSDDTQTYFSAEFIVSDIQYKYELVVDSLGKYNDYPSRTTFIYPVRHECLSFVDLRYEADREGNVVEDLVFERSNDQSHSESSFLSYLCEIKRLRSRLEYYNTITPNHEAISGNPLIEEGCIILDYPLSNQMMSKKQRNRWRYNTRLNLESNVKHLSSMMDGSKHLPLTINQQCYYDEEKNCNSTENIDRHLQNVRRWFSSNLCIMNTSDVYIRDSDESMDSLSRAIQSFDLGIDKLEWMRLGPRKARTIWDGLSITDQLKLEDLKDATANTKANSRLVVKSSSGIYRFTFSEEKPLVEELIPVHRDGSNHKLYSESDGTVRVIELASTLCPTKNDITFIIDELDRRIHPMLTRRMIELFLEDESPSKQLIFSTHETEILTTDLFRKDEIWFVQKMNGESSLQPLDQLNNVNFNKRLERLYLEDKVLPGIPHTK